MSMPVLTVEGEATVMESVKRMRANNVGCLCILKDGKPLGIITERDVIKLLGRGKNITTLKVKEAMTKNPKTVGLEATLLDITKLMNKHYFRRVIIVDELGKVAGIVTTRDLITLISA